MSHTRVPDLKPAIELGARLGAKHLLVVGNDPDSRRLQANFAALCELAHPLGIGIAVELISYVELRTLPQALALLEAVRPKNVGLLIDALHLYRSGAGATDLAGIDPTLFPYMHFCDALARPPSPEGVAR